jgi:glucosyl-3-phosphoglycerate synthase
MSDFHQTGQVATFHRFSRGGRARIEKELCRLVRERPIALVLPSLYDELEGNALKNIIGKLGEIKYINDVIVTLGPCSRDDFSRARAFFSVLPQRTRIIWNTGPRIKSIYRTLEKTELPTGEPGKGRSAWMAYGYVLSQYHLRVIALHDCDIISYDKFMPARLCYPVANPGLDYDFCKGYYSRVTDRMHGRVTRLLVTPLIRSLKVIIGNHPMLEFFDSFRYPLAGEFAMDVDMARVIRVPGDWGLEMGVLAEVYWNTSSRRVCQVDIAENYEHKHRELSPEDSSRGLHKMAIDISKSVFRTLASEGVVFSQGFFNTLLTTYVKISHEFLKRYEDDAAVNGLFFDRHSETLAMETFTKGIKTAAGIITENPIGVPLIPSWDRVISAIPDILERIGEAVEKDNA